MLNMVLNVVSEHGVTMIDLKPGYKDFLFHINEALRPFAGNRVLSEDSDLVNELGLSSLQVMEMIEQIEDRFDISVPLNILPDITTIRDLAQQLERLASQ